MKRCEAAAAAPAGPHRKPRPDLYTVLLVIALLAILIGILFLYLEMRRYEFKFKGGPPVANGEQQPSTFSDQWPALTVGMPSRVMRSMPLHAIVDLLSLIPNP